LDGSRLFNAAIATGLSVTTIASPFDTVTVCFSKGLGCPAGAILAFNERYYAKVRRLKQLMGGSMRQSGMLAAAALYALEHHVNRLADDHAHAAYLAARLAEIQYIQVEPNSRRTNMVFFAWDSPTVSCEIFWAACKAKGVRFSQVGKNRLRAVTHLDIQHSDIEQAVTIIKEIVNAL
jgi:threonine aldolase